MFHRFVYWSHLLGNVLLIRLADDYVGASSTVSIDHSIQDVLFGCVKKEKSFINQCKKLKRIKTVVNLLDLV